MSEQLIVTGTIEKASDSRGPWGPLSLDVTEEVEADLGCQTFTIAASTTHVMPMNGLAALDGVIIKTGVGLTITAAFSGGGSMTNVPIRETLLLLTEGLTALSITNPTTAPVLVTVARTLKSTTT